MSLQHPVIYQVRIQKVINTLSIELSVIHRCVQPNSFKNMFFIFPDCLTSFIEVEELAETELYYCNNCKSKQRSTKRFWIRRLPNVRLVLARSLLWFIISSVLLVCLLHNTCFTFRCSAFI